MKLPEEVEKAIGDATTHPLVPRAVSQHYAEALAIGARLYAEHVKRVIEGTIQEDCNCLDSDCTNDGTVRTVIRAELLAALGLWE